MLYPGDWRDEAQKLLAEAIPSLVWSITNDKYAARCSSQESGRFDLNLDYINSVTVVSIRGSYRADQLELIKLCAQAINGYAFDMQTCERIWPIAHGT